MKKTILLAACLFALLVSSGCASSNLYKRYYKPITMDLPEGVKYPPVQQVEVISLDPESFTKYSDRVDKDTPYEQKAAVAKELGLIKLSKLMANRSKYVVLGASMFSGPYTGEEKAVEVAQKIGASIVMVCIAYTHTASRTSLIPEHHPAVISDINMFGDIKRTPAYTTYQAVPYNVQIFNHDAYYFRAKDLPGPIEPKRKKN